MDYRRNIRFKRNGKKRSCFDIHIKTHPDRKKLSADQIINISVAMLALCSVLISIFTLYEMREQRTAAYRPDIVFGEVEYELN